MNTISELATGQDVGKYRIVRELGRGGMGVVYLAVDVSLGRNVALKLLHPALSLSEDFVLRFKQEARAIATLSHPNIVDIHSLDVVDGRLLIDVRYLEGGSLANRFSSHVITGPELVRWSSEILSALSQCHRAGIIHRDVKPSNILFDTQSHALLSDFGLAKAYSSHVESAIAVAASTGFFLGSPRYAPLEAWSDNEPNPCWDVYSLGIVIYEAISGAVPYSGATPLAILNQIMNNSIPPLDSVCSEVSPALSRLVDDMVHRNPKQRPRDGADALERLSGTPEYEMSQRLGECTLVIPRRPDALSSSGKLTPPSGRYPYGFSVSGSAEGRADSAGQAAPARLKPRKGRLALLSVFGISVVLAAVGFVAYRQYTGRSTVPGRTSDSVETVQTLSQADYTPPTLPTAADLLLLPKEARSPRFASYEVSYPEGVKQAPQSWFIGDSGTGTASALYAIGPSFLARLKLEPSGDALFRLQGDWAEYLDTASSVLRYGTVTGQGRWLREQGVFTASLQFTSLQDGATFERTVAGSRSTVAATDSRLCATLEEQPNLQALLQNELLPRHILWANDIEQLLPAIYAARVDVPAVSGALMSFKADGRLDDPVWSAPDKDFGIIRGWPASRSPRMLVRRCDEGVFLALQAQSNPTANAAFEIAVLQDYYVPIQDSPAWVASLASSGESALSRRVRNRTVSAECTWKTGVFIDAASATAEVFIPFDATAKGAPAQTGERWRVNARLSGLRHDGSAVPEVIWGFPEFDEVFHGAIILLGAGASDNHQ